MFEDRINGFVPNMVAPSFSPGVFPTVRESKPISQSPMAIQIADLYQAAINRAIEDHEIDKLFNPDFGEYQI